MRPTFATRGRYHFHIGRTDEAAELFLRHHYSKRVAANVQLCVTAHDDGGLFGDYGPAIAALTFSLPPTRWSQPVWELSRLVKEPQRPEFQLSELIGFACRWIKRRALADLLVSFADATHEHHGGVYQAASWRYDGQRDETNDGLIVNGVFVPGRSCNSRWGTRSATLLSARFPDWRIEPHIAQGKHLYWRAMSRRGKRWARELELTSAPYPRPSKITSEAA